MRTPIAAVIAAGLLVSACSGGSTHHSAPATTHPATVAGSTGYAVVNAWNPNGASGPTLRRASCQLHPAPASDGKFAEPDPTCTPGAVVSDINYTNAKTTVCAASFLATRTTSDAALKSASAAVLAAYGLPAGGKGYQIQFLIPPALGGAFDLRNLWPVPQQDVAPKAGVDQTLSHAICAGKGGVQAAQFFLARRWTSATQSMHLA